MTDKELIRLLHQALNDLVYQTWAESWRVGIRCDEDVTDIVGKAMTMANIWESKQND